MYLITLREGGESVDVRKATNWKDALIAYNQVSSVVSHEVVVTVTLIDENSSEILHSQCGKIKD